MYLNHVEPISFSPFCQVGRGGRAAKVLREERQELVATLDDLSQLWGFGWL